MNWFQDWLELEEKMTRTEHVSIEDLIMDGYSRIVNFFGKPVP